MKKHLILCTFILLLPFLFSPTVKADTSLIRIDSGSTNPYIDSNGNTWVPDYGYYNGSYYDWGDIPIDTTSDDRIYQTEHRGPFSYSVPVVNGTYRIILHFAETNPQITSAGQRVFDINVAGSPYETIDIYNEAGGRNKPLIKTYERFVTGQRLVVNFLLTDTSVLYPVVQGIEIIPIFPELPGDANNDRKVDGIDWSIWMLHYSFTSMLGVEYGDFNRDGKVDGIDFVVWLNNYGKVASPTPNP